VIKCADFDRPGIRGNRALVSMWIAADGSWLQTGLERGENVPPVFLGMGSSRLGGKKLTHRIVVGRPAAGLARGGAATERVTGNDAAAHRSRPLPEAVDRPRR